MQKKWGTAGKFRDIHGLLKSAIYIVLKKSVIPSADSWRDFFHTYLKQLFGKVVDYVNATVRAWLPRVRMSKKCIVAKLMEQRASGEVAEKVYNLVIHVLSQPVPIAIGEDIRQKLCEKARPDFGVSLEKPGKEEEPCLEDWRSIRSCGPQQYTTEEHP